LTDELTLMVAIRRSGIELTVFVSENSCRNYFIPHCISEGLCRSTFLQLEYSDHYLVEYSTTG